MSTTTSPAPEQATVRPHRSHWLAVAVLLVVIGVGAAITAVVVTRGDDAPSETAGA